MENKDRRCEVHLILPGERLSPFEEMRLLILMQNAFRFRATFRGSVRRARRSLYSGDVAIPLFIMAAAVFVVGIIRGYNTATVAGDYDNFQRGLLFVEGSFYWLVGAFLIIVQA